MSKGFFGEPLELHEMILISTMGEPDAVDCYTELLKGKTGLSDISYLNSLGLSSEMIAKLWNEACSCDADNLRATIEAFKNGAYTREQIIDNLSQWVVEPFI